MEQEVSTSDSSMATGEWRRVSDPPKGGAVVLVKDENVPGWEELAFLVAPTKTIWMSEISGHLVYPTHWKELE